MSCARHRHCAAAMSLGCWFFCLVRGGGGQAPQPATPKIVPARGDHRGNCKGEAVQARSNRHAAPQRHPNIACGYTCMNTVMPACAFAVLRAYRLLEPVHYNAKCYARSSFHRYLYDRQYTAQDYTIRSREALLPKRDSRYRHEATCLFQRACQQPGRTCATAATFRFLEGYSSWPQTNVA